MKVPNEEFEKLHSLLDIVNVIQHYLPDLKKTGKDWTSSCPFHTEKTPSFKVMEHGKFANAKCFGCGWDGDLIKFVKDIEPNCETMSDAARLLAARYNIELVAEHEHDNLCDHKHEDIILANKFACEFFEKEFLAYRPVKKYIYSRGYTDINMIKKWNIGYAPANYHLKYDIEVLKKADLIKENGRPKFTDRLIFPIKDDTGRIVGFSGRTWRLGDDDRPKYLNTAETGAFIKSNHLYGLYQNRKFISKTNSATLVEGYTDVALAPKGMIFNAVGGMGTAFTDEQAQLLANYIDCHTGYVNVFYDGGMAGKKAAAKAVTKLWRHSLHSKIVRAVPNYKREDWDCAQMCQDHGTKINNFLTPTENFAQVQLVYDMIESDNDYGRQTELLKFIGKCPNPLKRHELLLQTAKVTKVFVRDLREMLNIHLPKLTFSNR
jgi:DNA primase